MLRVFVHSFFLSQWFPQSSIHFGSFPHSILYSGVCPLFSPSQLPIVNRGFYLGIDFIQLCRDVQKREKRMTFFRRYVGHRGVRSHMNEENQVSSLLSWQMAVSNVELNCTPLPPSSSEFKSWIYSWICKSLSLSLSLWVADRGAPYSRPTRVFF